MKFDIRLRNVSKMLEDPANLSKSTDPKQLAMVCDALIRDTSNLYSGVKTMREFTGDKLGKTLATDSAFQKHMAPINSMIAPADRRAFIADPFGTVENASKTYVGILQEVKRDLPNLFGKESIKLANIRTNGVLAVGVLRQAICLNAVYRSMLACATGALTGLKVYPMHDMRLEACAETFAHTINDLNQRRGAIKFRSLTKSVRENALDVSLVTPDGDLNPLGIEAIPEQRGLVTAGIAGLPFLKDIGYAWNVMVKKLDRNLEKEESWIMAHAALLAAAVGGMSETDPEYIDAMKKVKKLEDIANLMAKFRKWMY